MQCIYLCIALTFEFHSITTAKEIILLIVIWLPKAQVVNQTLDYIDYDVYKAALLSYLHFVARFIL